MRSPPRVPVRYFISSSLPSHLQSLLIFIFIPFVRTQMSHPPTGGCVCVYVKHLSRCKTPSLKKAGDSGPLMNPLPTKLLRSWGDIGTDHPDVPAKFTIRNLHGKGLSREPRGDVVCFIPFHVRWYVCRNLGLCRSLLGAWL